MEDVLPGNPLCPLLPQLCVLRGDDFEVMAIAGNEVRAMLIEVLGTGCPKCKKVFETMEAALRDLSLAGQVELVKVTDMAEIVRRGVLMTPAVAVDGKVHISGKVPSMQEARALILRETGVARG